MPPIEGIKEISLLESKLDEATPLGLGKETSTSQNFR